MGVHRARPWPNSSSTTTASAHADLVSLTLLSIGSAPLAPDTLLALLEQAARRDGVEQLRDDRGRPRVLRDAEGRGAKRDRLGRHADAADGDAHRRRPRATTTARSASDGEVLVRNEGPPARVLQRPGSDRAHVDRRRLVAHAATSGTSTTTATCTSCGRMKEVIIRGGNNIYATDVEAVLLRAPGGPGGGGRRHPARRARRGRRRVRGARSRAQRSTPTSSPRSAPSASPTTRFPRRVTFLDELPRNATGKVLKHQLKEQGWHSMS